MISTYHLYETSIPTAWRERVEVFILDKDKFIVGKNSKGIFLPGGGIEPGDSKEKTAKKECYEELGCIIDNVEFIKTSPFYLDYHELYSKGNMKSSDKIKERMKSIRGIKTYFVKAQLVNIDNSAKLDDTDKMKPYAISKKDMVQYWMQLIKNKPELKDYAEKRINIINTLL